MKKHIKNNQTLFIVGVVAIIGWLILSTNYEWYNEPIVQLIQEEQPMKPSKEQSHDTQFQQFQAKRLNGPQKDQKITIRHHYIPSEASSMRYRVGDEVFVTANRTAIEIRSVKRDRYVWAGMMLFLMIVLAVGRMKSVAAVLSIFGNLLLYIVVIYIYTSQLAVPLLPAVVTFSVLAVLLMAFSMNGWNAKSVVMAGSTLISTALAWGTASIIMKLTGDQGIRFEEMEFLTRPYRQVFVASLLIGTLGATTDVAVTIVSTMSELLEQHPGMQAKEMLQASRRVGRNILGPMINILFFVYVSEALPLMFLYLENDWTYTQTAQITLSLELMRALVGALGITLTVPVSAYLSSILLKRGAK
ncbi:YibE/F family protein [Atopobacter phocae]|uniref:YibE/F family protein n=1 Tax=Atopobacter phocae TaxID=136492 RepID=UPI0004705CD5|nr:YibE/F family protein [Atopobacter phocae]